MAASANYSVSFVSFLFAFIALEMSYQDRVFIYHDHYNLLFLSEHLWKYEYVLTKELGP